MVIKHRMQVVLKLLLAGLALLLVPTAVYAAVGCRLNNPDQDIKRLFPKSTNYRTHFIRINQRGGEKLYRALEKRLGDKWDPNWETSDIPYAYYEVLKGPERIGWVFGASQGYPGADNAQVIIATDTEGRVKEIFFQKLPSLEKDKFQNKKFYGQFVGLTLEHFYLHEAFAKYKLPSELAMFDTVGQIKDPSEREHEGFKKLLRGIKKVLVNFDEFWLKNATKKDAVFLKAKQLTEKPERAARLEGPLSKTKESFKQASRVVAELPAPADRRKKFVKEFWTRIGDNPDKGEEDGKVPMPVLLVYQLDNYEGRFIRGKLLGYLILVPPEGGGKEPVVIVAADPKGKLVGVSNKNGKQSAFSNSVKGLSLTNFYVHDAFKEFKASGGKLDKVFDLPRPESITRKDFVVLLRRIKKALVVLDEFYLGNYYKRNKVFELVKKYLEKQKGGGK